MSEFERRDRGNWDAGIAARDELEIKAGESGRSRELTNES
jgi:hypothetical protein